MKPQTRRVCLPLTPASRFSWHHHTTTGEKEKDLIVKSGRMWYYWHIPHKPNMGLSRERFLLFGKNAFSTSLFLW